MFQLGLAAVEEAGGQEDDGDHEGQAGVEDIVVTDADECVDEPCCEAHEPDPRCLSHHRSYSIQREVAFELNRRCMFYTK